jgi:ornithine carbamoyltransferase
MKHLLSLADYSKKEILDVIELAQRVKKNPKKYSRKLQGKKLLMLFAKPSLRTRLSFEVAMLELGGHAIFYDMATSPLGKKESIKDGAHVTNLYVDAIMARLYEHATLVEFAQNSKHPVINGLTNSFHPCQVLGDLLTIKEVFGNYDISLSYFGDANNNVTHSLIVGCNKLEIPITISCPRKKEFMPDENTVRGLDYRIVGVSEGANANVIYTDSWQSYHIKDKDMARRKKVLRPFQVNNKIFSGDSYFMHCLPALRGAEVTSDVIDGSRSLILQQAENRLHIEKAILLKVL